MATVGPDRDPKGQAGRSRNCEFADDAVRRDPSDLVAALLGEHGFVGIVEHKDLAGKPRFVVARR